MSCLYVKLGFSCEEYLLRHLGVFFASIIKIVRMRSLNLKSIKTFGFFTTRNELRIMEYFHSLIQTFYNR